MDGGTVAADSLIPLKAVKEHMLHFGEKKLLCNCCSSIYSYFSHSFVFFGHLLLLLFDFEALHIFMNCWK